MSSKHFAARRQRRCSDSRRDHLPNPLRPAECRAWKCSREYVVEVGSRSGLCRVAESLQSAVELLRSVELTLISPGLGSTVSNTLSLSSFHSSHIPLPVSLSTLGGSTSHRKMRLSTKMTPPGTMRPSDRWKPWSLSLVTATLGRAVSSNRLVRPESLNLQADVWKEAGTGNRAVRTDRAVDMADAANGRIFVGRSVSLADSPLCYIDRLALITPNFFCPNSLPLDAAGCDPAGRNGAFVIAKATGSRRREANKY